MIKAKQKLVVLSGAGISAESGLKTFRDSDGLWEGYNVYEVATPTGFKNNPQLVLDFYNERRKDVAKALPNEAHKALAALEKDFDVHIITQNIDDLHERGGSKKVLHLHGEIFKSRSVNNASKTYECKGDINLGDLAPDGSQLRPFIVWFEEAVPMMNEAVRITEEADIFVVIGTSLQVYPAAGLLNYVNPYASKYIIDKHIPSTENLGKIVAIEATASEGVLVLQQLLNG
ncbi:MAG: SIR2 family NAD-dependent protein deacylase [Chitinophagaceae bacterium]|jgi:NAD-dependent deacetylase